MIIAIDGPAGAGKSTVASVIAKELGFFRLDTGAIYRTVAYAAHRANLNENDPKIEHFVKSLALTLSCGEVHLDGSPIGDLIRTPEMGPMASRYSASPYVRRALLVVQRNAVAGQKFIVDGRDIGTVVFPDAPVKIFLTASVDARAQRRWSQYSDEESRPSIEEVRAEIEKRDLADSSRPIAPLSIPHDAVVVDSSELSFEETVAQCISVIRKRLGEDENAQR